MKKQFAAAVLILWAAAAYAQEGPAPTVLPGPKPLPAAQVAPRPNVLPGPSVAAGPMVGPAPLASNSPSVGRSPVILSAPVVSVPAPNVGPAPRLQSAPSVRDTSGNLVTSRPAAPQQGNPESLYGGGNIIEISAAAPRPPVPYGTAQVTLENANKSSAQESSPSAPSGEKRDMAAQNKAVAGLKAWDKKLTSLKTGFTQISTYDGTEVSSSSGMLYFSKPNKIRLESLDKDGKITQITLTDKKKIKIFDADMKPVQTYNWKDWFDNQPNKAFFDFGHYSALFKTNEVTDYTDNKNGTFTLTLEPPARDQKIFITASKKTFFPAEIALEAEQMLTTAVLKNTVINQELPENIFQGL